MTDEDTPGQAGFERLLSQMMKTTLRAAATIYDPGETDEEGDTLFAEMVYATRDFVRTVDALPPQDRPEDWGPTLADAILAEADEWGGYTTAEGAEVTEAMRQVVARHRLGQSGG